MPDAHPTALSELAAYQAFARVALDVPDPEVYKANRTDNGWVFEHEGRCSWLVLDPVDGAKPQLMELTSVTR